MKFLLLILAIVLVACGGSKREASDTTQYAAPPMVDSVAYKIPPDTLVNEKGKKCVVHPQGKYDGVSVGDHYECNWE
jgi:hypothetical protein